MSKRTHTEYNTRSAAHRAVKRAVAKMEKLARDLAEDCIALEYDYNTTEFSYALWDDMKNLVSDVEALVDQGQLKLF